MDYKNILSAVLVLGILGGVFGLMLAYASKIFATNTDARLAPVLEALPGANCGGCGYSGCAAYANAIISGKAKIGACHVGGEATAKRIAQIMGVRATTGERMVAMVLCSGGNRAEKKFQYTGLQDCVAAAAVGGTGPLECAYGCLGMGTCVNACQFGAMHIVDGAAHVDHEKCTDCMQCSKVCPRHLITRVPYNASVTVACASRDKGAVTRVVCEAGCIACKLCEKACPHDAIHVIDNLAAIDYSKCVSCGECVAKCPRNLIAFTDIPEHSIPKKKAAQRARVE